MYQNVLRKLCLVCVYFALSIAKSVLRNVSRANVCAVTRPLFVRSYLKVKG